MVSPDFLPYRVFAISDEPLNHVSLELVTLQGNGPIFLESHEILCRILLNCSNHKKVFLPTLLEQTHIKIFLKTVIRLWAESVGYILDLRGYLLGERIWRNFGEAIEDPEPGGFLRAPEQNQNGDENEAPQEGDRDEPEVEQDENGEEIILEEGNQEPEQVNDEPVDNPVEENQDDIGQHDADGQNGAEDPNHGNKVRIITRIIMKIL